MHIIYVNGSEFKGSWADVTRALRHPLFVGFILVMTGLIFVLNPYEAVLPDEVMTSVLIVTSAVMVFLAIVIFGLSRYDQTGRPVHTLKVTVPATILTTIWAVSASVLAGGTMLSVLGAIQLLAFNFVFCLTGEMVFASFLLRRIALETGMGMHPVIAQAPGFQTVVKAAEPTPAPAPLPTGIEILGQWVLLDALWHLKAEEHYVRLCLRDGTAHLQRGRLADAIAQVSDAAGLQVHRSHWIATAAVQTLERRRDGWRLTLRNGTVVPVARNRQTTVSDWVEAALQSA